MVLRPYQYYAVEAMIDRVKNSTQGGYIWHTTGSGKTLTAFKASQILTQLPQVDKVVFVVDRKDLDFQTTKEFNSFSEGSVDGTDNTSTLVKQFLGIYEDKKGVSKNSKLIVTTLQKLNTAISKGHYERQMASLKDKRIVFIFDECHRSQFGETHLHIKRFFKNIQLFGFTGTPIFKDNVIKNDLGKRTTADLFGKCLHKYVITDAIRDENVLKFSVEYVGKYRRKDGAETDIDIEVEAIDTQELMEDGRRLSKIVDFIITHHNRKTHNREYTAMFCVESVPTLIKYYDLFKQKKEAGLHDLTVATIFSYNSNEDDPEATSIFGEGEGIDNFDLNVVAEPPMPYGKPKNTPLSSKGSPLDSNWTPSREKLESFIEDYNQTFNAKFTTRDSESFYKYYNDIAKQVKERRVDVLLVVNMFLTGFDSPMLNTLYVDKNLKYHGLIQAYSRTNRIVGESKSQGNIVSFRNLKNRTDEAITLFSNKEAIETIVMQPYETYVKKFDTAYNHLLDIAPTVDSVNDLESEDDELAFVQAFRDLMRTLNVMKSFADFKWDDVAMTAQTFEDYKSKYLDLHDKVKTNHQKEKVSILEDVDFELELIHRDDINVAYILQLLIQLKTKKQKDKAKAERDILNLLNTETTLRSKRELIEQFIQNNLPFIHDSDSIKENFETFWQQQKDKALRQIIKDEDLNPQRTQTLIDQYLFAEKPPLSNEAIELLEGEKPSILIRRKTGDRILQKLMDFVETYIFGMGDLV
jgi:type I restriction enzyme, R subunit